MLGLMKLQNFVLSHIFRDITLFDSISLLRAKYNHFTNAVYDEFGPNGLYVLVLFTIFLIMLLIIYAKSVYDTIGNSEESTSSSDVKMIYISSTASTEEDYDEQDQNNQSKDITQIPEYQEDTNYSKIKASKSVEQSKANDEDAHSFKQRLKAQFEKDEEISRDLIVASKISNDYLHLSEDYQRMKEIMMYHAQTEAENLINWQKQKENYTETPENITEISEEKLTYRQEAQTLTELIPLIINMFGRNVSESKIIQVIYNRNQAKEPLENVIQIVRTIYDFIGLSTSNQFDNIPNKKVLPSPEEALFALSNGDNYPCLELLKELTKFYIDQASKQNNITQKLTYAQASHFACMSGNIAGLDDLKLAMNSYTLASELSAKNINAWSRIGDMYTVQGNHEKAMFAYQTVLEYSDGNIYGHQVANAKQHLAQYYKDLGIETKAQTLQQESAKFYKSYGYENNLTEAENKVINFLEKDQKRNLINSLTKLMLRNQT